MLVLGIHGSPRRGGNSEILLDHCLEAARQAGAATEKLRAAGLQIGGCRSCGGCDETGKCVVPDDMQQVYPLLDRAERIVLASPIFFYSFPAQIKALIDRAQAHWSRRQLRHRQAGYRSPTDRLGYVQLVGATRGRNLFQGAELSARYFYDALEVKYCGGQLVWRVDAKGTVRERPEEIERARQLGRQVVAATACP